MYCQFIKIRISLVNHPCMENIVLLYSSHALETNHIEEHLELTFVVSDTFNRIFIKTFQVLISNRHLGVINSILLMHNELKLIVHDLKET